MPCIIERLQFVAVKSVPAVRSHVQDKAQCCDQYKHTQVGAKEFRHPSRHNLRSLHNVDAEERLNGASGIDPVGRSMLRAASFASHRSHRQAQFTAATVTSPVASLTAIAPHCVGLPAASNLQP